MTIKEAKKLAEKYSEGKPLARIAETKDEYGFLFENIIPEVEGKGVTSTGFVAVYIMVSKKTGKVEPITMIPSNLNRLRNATYSNVRG